MDGDFEHNEALGLVREGKKYIVDVRSEVAKLGVAAFCEINNHSLMWAHYADQYRGICIAYDFSKLRDFMKSGVIFTRISYADKVTKLTRVRDDTAMVAKRVMSRKTRGWLYEREWRMIAPSSGQHHYSHECAKRVILGHRMPRKWRTRLETELKREKISTSVLDPRQLIASL
jgi:hypothetical protein